MDSSKKQNTKSRFSQHLSSTCSEVVWMEWL